LGAAALHPQSLPFVEELYAAWLRNPQDVPADWRSHFDKLPSNGQSLPSPDRGIFPRRSLFHGPAAERGPSATGVALDNALLQERVDRLIHAYRVRGHIVAHVDPLGQSRPEPPELRLEYY